MDKIAVATLGNSDQTQVGDQVIAIGNALGYGQSVTTGIVSAKDRTMDSYDGNFFRQMRLSIRETAEVLF